MPAALLAANIQALVRSMANVEANPVDLASKINQHLCRHTPDDRFATAVLVALDRDSGELTYVNAGHNPPVLVCKGSVTFLGTTGVPLGLFADAKFEAGKTVIHAGDSLVIYTDGLTDSIAAENPNDRLREVLAGKSGTTMSSLKSLVDPKYNEDDVTILLVKRIAPPGTLA